MVPGVGIVSFGDGVVFVLRGAGVLGAFVAVLRFAAGCRRRSGGGRRRGAAPRRLALRSNPGI